MKPLPAVSVPGNTPFERLGNALRMALSIPKDALLKEEKRQKKLRDKKRSKKLA